MPTPAKVYDNIKGYKNTALTDWDNTEELMFNSIMGWFSGWMRGNGMAKPSTETAVTVRGWLTTLEADGHLPNAARSFDGQFRLGSDRITSAVQCYEVIDLKSYIGAVHAIGSNSNAETRPYLIKFRNNTLVYLCVQSHYAYPVKLAGTVQTDLSHYNHRYQELMTAANDTPVNDVIRYLCRGTAIPATNNDMDLLTVLVANYFCESNRNWMQLLVSLILLGRRVTVGSGENIVSAPLTTFAAQAHNLFPMGGGGWTNHYSWGPGANPQRQQVVATDGRNIKRWFLAILMKFTLEMSAKVKGRPEGVLTRDDWVAWITRLQEAERPVISSTIENHLNAVLTDAVAAIKKVR